MRRRVEGEIGGTRLLMCARAVALGFGWLLFSGGHGFSLVGQGAPETETAQPEESIETAAGGLGNLEWRGVTVLEGKPEFSLHDASSRMSFWVGLGETENGIEVVEYSEAEGKLVVSDGAESRELFLSGGTVAELSAEPQQEPEPPPLVETPGLIAERARLNPESLPEEISSEARRVSRLWREAVQEEPRLREMDDQFRELRLESDRIEQAMSRVPEEAPEFRALETRQEQIAAEERVLTEAALTEVRASPELREQVGNELGDELREQIFGAPPQPRVVAPEPVEPVVQEPAVEEQEPVVPDPNEALDSEPEPEPPPVTDLDLEPPPPSEEGVMERDVF